MQEWRFNLDDPYFVIQLKQVPGGDPNKPAKEIVATALTKKEAERWRDLFIATEYTPAGQARKYKGTHQFYQVRGNTSLN